MFGKHTDHSVYVRNEPWYDGFQRDLAFGLLPPSPYPEVWPHFSARHCLRRTRWSEECSGSNMWTVYTQATKLVTIWHWNGLLSRIFITVVWLN